MYLELLLGSGSETGKIQSWIWIWNKSFRIRNTGLKGLLSFSWTLCAGRVAQFYFLSLPDLTEWFPEEEILRKRGEIANLIQVTLSHSSQLICSENIKN